MANGHDESTGNSEEQIPSEDPRLQKAVHEAGHAVVAKSLGLVVAGIRIDDVQSVPGQNVSWTDVRDPADRNDLDLANLRVAVAGYASVGVLLGAAAESANRKAELHDEAGSDVQKALTRLRSIGGTEKELTELFERTDAETRAALRETWVGSAAFEVAEQLYDMGQMSESHLDAIVQRIRGELGSGEEGDQGAGSALT